MTLISHSGTAAIDLRPAPRPAQVVISQKQGVEVPNVAALTDTAKDWIYQGGLYRPPPQVAWHLGISTATMHLSPGSIQFLPTGPFTPHAHSFTMYPAYAPPVVLPKEKREMPVIGYRSWKFQQVYKLGWGRKGALMPLHQSYGAWKAGKNQAICKTHVGHRAADVNCQCGFYVLASLDAAEQWAGGMADDVIVGAVVGWGQVVQHGSEGWRAEYARIIALLDCKFSEAQSRNTLTIAQTYKLEIKERGQLEAMVSEFGDPFEAAVTPSEVRP